MNSAKKALKELTTALDAEEEPEDIQNTIYQIAKSNDVQPKDFFKTLYQIILGTFAWAKNRAIHFRYWKKKSIKNNFRIPLADMAHDQHNKSRNSGGFALIILGALLLFLAPNIHPTNPELGILALVVGIIIGSLLDFT